MWKRPVSLVALAVAVLLVTAACAKTPGVGSGGTLPAEDLTTKEATTVELSGDADRVVVVELTEFAINADSLDFAPGETIEFVVTNAGVVEHEFRLSNQDRVDEHVAGGHDEHEEGAMTDEEMAAMDDEMDNEDADHDDEEADHDDEGMEAMAAEDVVLVVPAGETATIVFTFPENDHDFTAAVCLIPGHYEAGMSTDLSYNA